MKSEEREIVFGGNVIKFGEERKKILY